jgi:hypothetical protein
MTEQDEDYRPDPAMAERWRGALENMGVHVGAASRSAVSCSLY